MQTEQMSDLSVLQSIIAELPPEIQTKIGTIAKEIKRLVEDGGKEGFYALALIGLEMEGRLDEIDD